MQFDTALNAIWLALGVFALASTCYARRLRTRPHAPAWLHVSGVALIVAALFPYISATDDVLRIQHMDVQHFASQQTQLDSGGTKSNSSHQREKQSSTETLIRLYAAMDTPVIETVREISFTPFFVGFVATLVFESVTRHVTLRNGRSPPAAFLAF